MTERAAMQDYRSMVVYLTEEIWTGLAAADRSQLAKVDLLVRHVVERLGLRHPSEPTQAVLAAIVAQHLPAGVAMTPLLQTVKSVVKTAVIRATQSGIPFPAGEYIQTLPNAVQDLSLGLQQHFAAANLVFAAPPPRVSIDEILQVARGMPLRSTHRTVQLQRQLHEQQQNMFGLGNMGMPAQGMQVAQTAAIVASVASVLQGAGQRGENSLPNLQIFGQGHRSEGAASSPRNGGLGMLLDRAESQPVAAATTAAPLLALTDGAAELPRQARPKVESVAGGVPPHAAASHEASGTAAAPVSTSPAAAEAMVPAGSPAASGIGQAMQSSLGEAAAAAEALARAHYEIELPDLSENSALKKPASRLASTKQGAAGGCMKRPASRMPESKEKVAEVAPAMMAESAAGMKRPAGLMKRPAAASSVKVQKRSDESCLAKPKKACSAAEWRRRLKLRPNGCGKCRYTPGCCPSCFV